MKQFQVMIFEIGNTRNFRYLRIWHDEYNLAYHAQIPKGWAFQSAAEVKNG